MLYGMHVLNTPDINLPNALQISAVLESNNIDSKKNSELFTKLHKATRFTGWMNSLF